MMNVSLFFPWNHVDFPNVVLINTSKLNSHLKSILFFSFVVFQTGSAWESRLRGQMHAVHLLNASGGDNKCRNDLPGQICAGGGATTHPQVHQQVGCEKKKCAPQNPKCTSYRIFPVGPCCYLRVMQLYRARSSSVPSCLCHQCNITNQVASANQNEQRLVTMLCCHARNKLLSGHFMTF